MSKNNNKINHKNISKNSENDSLENVLIPDIYYNTSVVSYLNKIESKKEIDLVSLEKKLNDIESKNKEEASITNSFESNDDELIDYNEDNIKERS